MLTFGTAAVATKGELDGRGGREVEARQRAGNTLPQGERGAWQCTPHHSPAKKKVSLKKIVAKSTYPLKSQV